MLSTCDLFRIGIGPSSSHTIGPMRAAKVFAINAIPFLPEHIKITLYGSLAYTGKSHGTETALLLGLLGVEPEDANPQKTPKLISDIKFSSGLKLNGIHKISFLTDSNIIYNTSELLAHHSNGILFEALDERGATLISETYYSIGGGFLLDSDGNSLDPPRDTPPYAFSSGKELLALCALHNSSISELMAKNEDFWHGKGEIEKLVHQRWSVMSTCIDSGLRSTEEFLPGSLKVKRRAPSLFRKLANATINTEDRLSGLDWLGLYAIAVNEENASYGRVVTAPTNGAAGVLPAVLRYHMDHQKGSQENVTPFFLTAAAIGYLFKRNASISGAEVGCQGEVGVATAMAAAGLTALSGGNPSQVEHAAEISMEHFLGLTCDPVGGLVQIPCIERNSVGAVKAVHASRMALTGDGEHKVSLDTVIKTMFETGKDMQSKYKETSLGGLAVNVPEC